MARIAYYRVSTSGQSIELQRHALGGDFAKEFSDEDVSGGVIAEKRKGFSALMDYIREGDELHVFAVDRLGRDAIDVQSTVRKLIQKGVSLHVHGIGQITGGAGELILAVLAQVADIERQRVMARARAGRERARIELARSGRTHRGKPSLGRPPLYSAEEVRKWRKENSASIHKTAEHFGVSESTVKRYCNDAFVGMANHA